MVFRNSRETHIPSSIKLRRMKLRLTVFTAKLQNTRRRRGVPRSNGHMIRHMCISAFGTRNSIRDRRFVPKRHANESFSRSRGNSWTVRPNERCNGIDDANERCSGIDDANANRRSRGFRAERSRGIAGQSRESNLTPLRIFN